MIEIFVPALLIAYLEGFRVAFNRPGYTYFIGFIWALMLIPGRKRVTDIANASFIKPLMEKGITVISRLRKNAVGWDDPPEYSGRGRPRKRGKKWKLADLLKEFEPESISVHIYGSQYGI